MKKSIMLLLLLQTLFALQLVSGCGKISSNGEYRLTRDLEAQGDCFIINASNVILDCDHHSITGNGSGIGIKIIYPGGNLTIKNCGISSFEMGISSYISYLVFNSVNYLQIYNTTVNGSEFVRNISSSCSNASEKMEVSYDIYVKATHAKIENVHGNMILITKKGSIQQIKGDMLGVAGLTDSWIEIDNVSNKIFGIGGYASATFNGEVTNVNTTVAHLEKTNVFLNHLSADEICIADGEVNMAFSFVNSYFSNDGGKIGLWANTFGSDIQFHFNDASDAGNTTFSTRVKDLISGDRVYVGNKWEGFECPQDVGSYKIKAELLGDNYTFEICNASYAIPNNLGLTNILDKAPIVKITTNEPPQITIQSPSQMQNIYCPSIFVNVSVNDTDLNYTRIIVEKGGSIYFNETYQEPHISDFVPINESGIYVIKVMAFDNAGQESMKAVSVNASITPPGIEILYPENRDYSSNITEIKVKASGYGNLTVSGTITGTGINDTEVSEDLTFSYDPDQDAYIASTNIGFGNYTLMVELRDGCGITREARVEFSVAAPENNPPQIEINEPGDVAYITEEQPWVKINVSISDDSGIKKVEAIINDSIKPDLSREGNCYVGQIELESGSYVLKIIAEDVYGNRQETTKVFEVKPAPQGIPIWVWILVLAGLGVFIFYILKVKI